MGHEIHAAQIPDGGSSTVYVVEHVRTLNLQRLALKLWPSQLPYLLPASRETAGVSSGQTLTIMHAEHM